MIDASTANKINDIFRTNQPVVIISHRNPDGDAIGSSTALALYLHKRNVPVHVIIPNEPPEFLKWLPGSNLVSIFRDDSKKCKELLQEAGTLIFLDFHEPDRIDEMKLEISASNAYKILIDHHQDPSDFADITISETWRGSVGEMIYELMVDLGGKAMIDQDIATCLYVAIITDTGNFKHSSSYPNVFHVIGELMEYGIDKDQIYTRVFDAYSEHRMKLMGYCLLEKMVVLPQYNTAYISLSREELEKFNHRIGDTEGFVNLPFSIEGIRMTALFIEKKGHVKISFRSKGKFSVNDFARKHFTGGGHTNAAGAQDYLSLNDTVKKFESLLANYEKELCE